MRLLTTTNHGQGQRPNDFSHADEGEIAYFGPQCSHAKVDDECGCARSMNGLNTRKGTTTVEVREVDITSDELVDHFVVYYRSWGLDAEESVREAAEAVAQLVDLGDTWPLGTILEIRGDRLGERPVIPARC